VKRAQRELRVGVVCYASLGGSGVVAADLAAGLAERGHRVHVIAGSPLSRPLPASDRLCFHQVTVPDYPLFEQAPYELALAAAIADIARTEQLDIVHTHYGVPHAASAYLARQALGAAAPHIVTTLHGTDVTGVGAHPSYRTITRFTVAASDALTVPSEFLRRAARDLLADEELPSIEVIPNFVDTDQFAPAAQRDRRRFDAFFPDGQRSDGPVLFHVSNFRPVKRVGDLLDVLARVRRRRLARLVLVGDGPERAHAAERAAALGVADAVCFLGLRTDFAEVLRHADAFVLPSETESFGVAALEALSSGVPVFGYRVGGLPEVVAPGVGTLVDVGDVAALADAVLAVSDDPQRHGSMASAARAHVLQRFRRDTAVDRYEACYRRVLEGPSRGGVA
jgi:N-acetyl-alpha-D-glucosaminyl L-malate synthase BshA